jgi:hypothetical protein
MADETEPLDLLGDPIREPEETRGRPPFDVTPELRNKVSVLRAGGMEYVDIAAAIGCSERTLRTYFLPELRSGAAVKKAAMIEAMFAAGMKGNVSAQRAFIGLGEKAGAMPPLPPENPAPQDDAEDEPEEKLGKKAQADKDALTAHEDDPEWATLLH